MFLGMRDGGRERRMQCDAVQCDAMRCDTTADGRREVGRQLQFLNDAG